MDGEVEVVGWRARGAAGEEAAEKEREAEM